MPSSVINASGDFEENIERLSKHLGRSGVRRAIFQVIYGRGTKAKSAAQIAELTGGKNPATVKNELTYLTSHELIARQNGGESKEYVYSRIPFVHANRKRIMKYADNPSLLNTTPTKRRPQPISKEALSPVAYARTSEKGKPSISKKLSILFLTASPSSQKALRTDAEMAAVQNEVRGSKLRDKVEIIARTAATPKSLLDGLNDHAPQVVHFSGHGGRGACGLTMEEWLSPWAAMYHLSFSQNCSVP